MCFGPRTMYWLLKFAAILGAVGAGVYSCNQLMYTYTTIRWSLLHFYNTIFSLFIFSAEFELLEHPALKATFGILLSYTGRALFYFFMGGLMLDSWGYVPGIWLLCTGAANIIALCFCKAQLDKTKADIAFERKQKEDAAANASISPAPSAV
jgi:hypothetical protein